MRRSRERPNDPDALDLAIRGWWLTSQPASMPRWKQAEAQFERAVQIDPAFVPALAGLVQLLMERWTLLGDPMTAPIQRIESLIAAAEAISPLEQDVLFARAYLVRFEERWEEAVAAFQELMVRYPRHVNGEFVLGTCFLHLGQSEEAIPCFDRAIAATPEHQNIWSRYDRLGQALLMAGRCDDAIPWFYKALAANPENSPSNHAGQYIRIAAAHALRGRSDKARAALAEADSIWPHATVRGYWQGGIPNAVFAAQLERVRDGLRLAGLRDHADEDANFGVPAERRLHDVAWGQTPTTLPGGAVIRTPELARLVQTNPPLVLDTVGRGRSIPGARPLRGGGGSGNLSDSVQIWLAGLAREITHGHVSAPIVTIGTNSEDWSGYNLALRLMALGYTHVRWYRGGREAWEGNDLPETESAAPAIR